MSRGTTNEERPFQPGDVIEYCGYLYDVYSNDGHGGMVGAHPGGVRRVYFLWSPGRHACRLHTPAPETP